MKSLHASAYVTLLEFSHLEAGAIHQAQRCRSVLWVELGSIVASSTGLESGEGVSNDSRWIPRTAARRSVLRGCVATKRLRNEASPATTTYCREHGQ